MPTLSGRVGVFGGTFDPPHIGHLVAAINALGQLSLDSVLLTVANDPWQKVGSRPITPAETRFALVEAAVAETPGLVADRTELDRGGDSVTADTLATLRQAQPDIELFLIVGADAASRLDTWRRVEELPALCTLAVVSRDGREDVVLPASLSHWRIERVTIPRLDVSSTEIRRRARHGIPLDFLVERSVRRLIHSESLYG